MPFHSKAAADFPAATCFQRAAGNFVVARIEFHSWLARRIPFPATASKSKDWQNPSTRIVWMVSANQAFLAIFRAFFAGFSAGFFGSADLRPKAAAFFATAGLRMAAASPSLAQGRMSSGESMADSGTLQ